RPRGGAGVQQPRRPASRHQGGEVSDAVTDAGRRIPAYLHVGTRSQQTIEIALLNGFDGVVLDLQPGELDLDSTSVLQRPVPDSLNRTLVRVPSLEPGVIGTIMDAGAGGIIAPCVESAEEAAAVVAAAKFAPVGGRSLGPMRPGLYAGPSATTSANQAVRA